MKRRLNAKQIATTVSILMSAVVSTALSQANPALNFFPLNSGDLRQIQYQYTYNVCPPWPPVPVTHSSYHVEEVLGDTLLPTGFQYKIVVSNLPQELPYRFLRVDSVSANVYRYEDYPTPHEILMDSLMATTGSWFIHDGWMTECTDVDTMTILGGDRIVKNFRSYFVHGSRHALAFGIGQVSYITYEDDGCYPALIAFRRDITFARINGEESGTFVGVNEEETGLPVSFELGQNYPNPFNPKTTIEFALNSAEPVHLSVYDLLGRQITVLVNEVRNTGRYSVTFDGVGVASGVLFYRLRAGSFVQTRKMILMK